MPSDPVVPDAILGSEALPGGSEAVQLPSGAQSPQTGQSGGGVGDSPVRGTLVQRGGAEEARQAHNLEAAGSNPAPVTASKALARDLAVVQKVDNKIRSRSERITAANGLAAYLDDNGNPIIPVDPQTGLPKGWTKVMLNIARDSKKTLKQQPGYISQQIRILESYNKADAGRPPAPTINADLIQINVLQVNQLPVRKVRED